MRCRGIGSALFLLLCGMVPVQGQDAAIKSEKKIVFGKGGDLDLELDLAMPAEGKGPFPAIVCIHGGGWKSGHRAELAPLIELFAKHRFVAVTVSYQFAPKHPFPAQVEDCKAAVRWLRANAEKYRVNPDKIGAVGFSAGGHLACMLGAANAKDGLEGNGGNPNHSSKIHAVVSFFGPTDLTEKTWNSLIENAFFVGFLGGKFEDRKEAYRKASPIVYCNRECPPFLFFHGTNDPLVDIVHSQRMSKKLRELGVSAELVTMEGDGHGWGGEKRTRTIQQTVRFFEEKLQK